MKRPDGYWTPERMLEASLPYTSRGEFRKGNNAAYLAATRTGFIHSLTHLDSVLSHWDRDAIIEAAKGCTTRTEFCRRFRGAHSAARRLGVVEEVNALLPKKKAFDDTSECFLYTYTHPEGYLYVGITNDPEYRHVKHLDNTKNAYVRWISSQVEAEYFCRYVQFSDKFEPFPMDRKTAERFERVSILRYVHSGWKVVNKHGNPQYDFSTKRYSWE